MVSTHPGQTTINTKPKANKQPKKHNNQQTTTNNNNKTTHNKHKTANKKSTAQSDAFGLTFCGRRPKTEAAVDTDSTMRPAWRRSRAHRCCGPWRRGVPRYVARDEFSDYYVNDTFIRYMLFLSCCFSLFVICLNYIVHCSGTSGCLSPHELGHGRSTPTVLTETRRRRDGGNGRVWVKQDATRTSEDTKKHRQRLQPPLPY